MQNETIGDYQLLEPLGSGMYGEVYRAENVRTHQVVAIKIMNRLKATSQAERERFFQEAKTLERLDHPHILNFLEAGIANNGQFTGLPYIITEYAARGSLRDRLIQCSPNPLPTQEAIAVLEQIGQALQYAHESNPSVVHCDLKPENILFNDNGDPNNAAGYVNKSSAFLGLKKYEEALTVSNQAISKDANSDLAYNNKAVALLKLNRLEEALAASNVAISLAPDYSIPYVNKALILNRMARTMEAQQALVMARRLGYTG